MAKEILFSELMLIHGYDLENKKAGQEEWEKQNRTRLLVDNELKIRLEAKLLDKVLEFHAVWVFVANDWEKQINKGYHCYCSSYRI